MSQTTATDADRGEPEDAFRTFDDPMDHKLLALVLALGAEVWAVKDRLALLEQGLAERGIEVSELIEELSGRPDQVEATKAQRSAYLSRFLGALTLEEG